MSAPAGTKPSHRRRKLHIGSQLMNPEPVMEAVDRVPRPDRRLRAKGFDIRHADLGGGLGVAYKPEQSTPAISSFIGQMSARLKAAACTP